MEKINPPVAAIAFPGIGVKQSGYEIRFFEDYEQIFSPFMKEASEYAGLDFIEYLIQDEIDDLEDSKKQFFTYAYCSAMFSVLSQKYIRPQFLAGYSFGIYAALYASGAITFSDGLAIIEHAYQLMAKNCCELKCGMALTIGLTQKEIRTLLGKKKYESLFVVNCNNDVCTIFSGTDEDLEDFLSTAKENDALTAEKLDVTIPYHNPTLLKGVSGKFEKFLRTLNWRPPMYPVVSSIDHRFIIDSEQLLLFTAANLSSPISWQNVVHALVSAKVKRIVECGPGISLTQNGRFISSEIKYLNLKNIKRKLDL